MAWRDDRRERIALRPDAEMHKPRHRVENFFCKIKVFRCIVTRRDKTGISVTASIHLVAVVLMTQ